VRRPLVIALLTGALSAGLASAAQADVKDDCYDITFRAATVCSKIPEGLPVLSDGS
jgi:hypothetical protein